MMEFMESKIMPIAMKIGNQKHLAAVRDAIIAMVSISIVGSLATLVNNFSQVEILDWKVGAQYNNLLTSIFGENWTVLGGTIWNGTLAFFTVFAVVGVSYKLARSYGEDGLEVILVAMSCYFVTIPQGTEAGIGGYLNNVALFTGIIVALLATEVFIRLSKIKQLIVKMPEGVPPAVGNAFAKLIPGMLTVTIFAIFNVLFTMIAKLPLNDWISKVLVQPLSAATDTWIAGLLIVFLVHLFWVFGLHGPNILTGITTPLFTQLGTENMELFNSGVTDWSQYNVIAGPFLDAFVYLGGSGATIGLVIAMLIYSRKKRSALIKLAGPTGVFMINEPILFGMPIVLNPIWAAPFILTPIVLLTTSYFAIKMGLVAPVAILSMPWVTPPIIGGLMATGGHISGGILAAINLVISVVIYFPFLVIADKIEFGGKNNKNINQGESL